MLVMILLAAISALDAPSAAGAQPAPSSALPASPQDCPDLRPRIAEAPPPQPGIADPTRPVRPRTLDELPPGRLELTVLRKIDGCPIPAVLREGIGGTPGADDGR
jgi:hypothetical protein